jgi:RNA polymerase sigma-70 factor (ECF subfamily)
MRVPEPTVTGNPTVEPRGDALDRELLVRHCAGDPGSFERLLARYRGPVVTFLYRLTGDLALAEDLGQETFLRVYRKATQFQGHGTGGVSSSVRSWIFAIARNLAVDHERLRFRLLGRGGRARSLGSAPELEGGEPPDRHAERQEVRAAVTRAIATLPEPFRSALLLVDISRLPYEEAALALGCGTKTLSSRLARARRQLRDRLHPDLLESLL